MSEKRPLPEFFMNWRKDWKLAAPLKPTDFLNQKDLVPGVIMASWLFCPDLIEYRHGVFLSERFERGVVDEWLNRLNGDISATELVVNATSIEGLFVDCDLVGLEDSIYSLATSIARCWEGIIRCSFPDRQPVVRIDDHPDDGPSVTFHTGAPTQIGS